MIIERRGCRRCSSPTTARMSNGTTVCFNCRTSWRRSDPQHDSGPRSRPAPASPPYPSTPPEVARLAIYRATSCGVNG